MKNKNPQASNRENLCFWIFAYAFCYAFFHIVPVFVEFEIKNKLLLGDILDILTPFIVLFLVFKLYHILKSNSSVKLPAVIILIFGAIIFVEGHGMHLAANAIFRHISSYAAQNTPIYALTYFFDETLGHIFWDSGIIILSAGIILIGTDVAANHHFKPGFVFPGSLLYGFTYFVNGVEGQTVVFTLPMALIIPAAIFLYGRTKQTKITKNPVLCFFACAYLVALILFIIWGILQEGFPEFSAVGWI